MGNTLLTPSIIAREALMVLRNNAVMAKLVHRDYSNEFVAGVGDTITVVGEVTRKVLEKKYVYVRTTVYNQNDEIVADGYVRELMQVH
mgnify:CR=1 FL=1